MNTSNSYFYDDIQQLSEQRNRKSFLMNDAKTLNLKQKERMAIGRIKEFLKLCKNKNLVPVISFSGGKDSCVLRHLVHTIDKNIKCETAAELFHPDIAKFLKTIADTTIIPPIKTFDYVIKHFGYPILSKEVAQKINNVRTSKTIGFWLLACLGQRSSRPIPKKYLHFLDETLVEYHVSDRCCDFIKGRVKNSITPKFDGSTVFESQLRKSSWLRHGCNFLSAKCYKCRPISLWKDEDIWAYIKKYNLDYSDAYRKGWQRTGCVACGFGLSFEQMLSKKGIAPSRYELLYRHYPNIYKHYMYGNNQMYKALADAGIDLDVKDSKYKKYFKKRQKLIKDWYSDANFFKNLNKVLDQIENRTNQKFEKDMRKQIINFYTKRQIRDLEVKNG